jgi:hypothetical protein
MEATSLWQLVTTVGPVVLAVVIIYALVRRRRLTSTEQRRQDEAVEELYKDKDPADRPPDELR